MKVSVVSRFWNTRFYWFPGLAWSTWTVWRRCGWCKCWSLWPKLGPVRQLSSGKLHECVRGGYCNILFNCFSYKIYCSCRRNQGCWQFRRIETFSCNQAMIWILVQNVYYLVKCHSSSWLVVTSSTQQLNAVVNLVQQKSPSKKAPLIIMHHRRTKGGSAASTYASNLLKKWTQNNTIYTTPTGSNDDWYVFKCEPNPMLISWSDRIYIYVHWL